MGVALTGSLARMEESKIHDIDLVVFHNGTIPDGSAECPKKERFYFDSMPLSRFLEDDPTELIEIARGSAPLNMVFVDQKILGDCEYLQTLAKTSQCPDFFFAVFTEIPLLLIRPGSVEGYLLRYIFGKGYPVEYRSDIKPFEFFPYMFIHHECSSAICKPSRPWSVRRKEIKQRKNHWWHR